uniref:Reverse transcriptase zinc-binding domain-containing protein n=1 Tax=Lactuca sativa TaxID=4236 RepID=A0A9R1W4C8_LACSA|nr:hypothetical protein LSAT_V11C300125490 [Lactuca sativa]
MTSLSPSITPVVLKEACDHGIFKGVNFQGNDPCISHLFYADDALFLGEWSKANINDLARILRCFYASLGLKVNFCKSQVFGIAASQQQVNRWARLLGCELSSLPFIYLGVSVGANMKLKKHWRPILNRFNSKLSEWKARNLSFGERDLPLSKVDRIPSTVNLLRRGISSMDKYCSYCGGVEETTDHLLCGCRAACTLTDLVFRWYGIQHSNFSYTSEVLEFVYNWGSCLNRRRMLIGICYGMLWCIWRARNDRVFNNIKTNPERVLGRPLEVISRSWTDCMLFLHFGVCGIFSMDVNGSLEVRSEVATSDLEWRRIREHESPCVGVFSEACMSQTLVISE